MTDITAEALRAEASRVHQQIVKAALSSDRAAMVRLEYRKDELLRMARDIERKAGSD